MMRISLCLGFLLTLLFPEWKLNFLSPFFSLLVLTKTPLSSLWTAALIGFSFDALGSHEPFGMVSLTFVISTFFLISVKHFLFTDRQETLPLMSALFSFSQSAQMLFFLKGTLVFSLGTELFLMPLLDALLALPFCSPTQFFKKRVTV